MLIGAGFVFRGENAPAFGWLARAERVVEPIEDCPEAASLRTCRGFLQLRSGDLEGAQAAFAEGVAAGRQFGDADLVTMALLGAGMCLLFQGQQQAGIALLDEVMVGVTSGEASPLYAGIAYCTVIACCFEIFDLRRARQWTAALTGWCDAQSGLVPYRGNCLIHRCELMQLAGAWNDAVVEARRACDLSSRWVTWNTLGPAYHQLGELQRLRGEFADAEQSYRKASESGRRPEPGLALLRLAQGRTAAATSFLSPPCSRSSDRR